MNKVDRLGIAAYRQTVKFSVLVGIAAVCINSAFGGEKRLLDKIKVYTDVIEQLSRLIRGANWDTISREDESRDYEKVEQIVKRLKTLQQQKEFAILAFFLSRFESEEPGNDQIVFENAFRCTVDLIAENKSAEAAEALRSIERKVFLDAGLGHDFRRAKERQAAGAKK